MRKLAVLTILALLAVTTANAAQTIQTQNYSGIPNYTAPLTFNQFDDNGGTYTLNSILVRLTINSDGGELLLDNDGVDPASGNWEFGTTGTISSLDVTLLNSGGNVITADAQAYNSGSFSLAGDDGDGAIYDYSTPDGQVYPGSFVSDTQQDYVNPLVWAWGTGYLGSGTFDIAVAADQYYDYDSTGGIQFAGTPASADGCVTVIYDYTIPEPATMALLGLGLAFLRKKKVA